MNLTLPNILGGVIFGILGVAFFRRGKDGGNFFLILCGIVLMVFPYFVENAPLLWAIGIVISFFAYKQI